MTGVAPILLSQYSTTCTHQKLRNCWSIIFAKVRLKLYFAHIEVVLGLAGDGLLHAAAPEAAGAGHGAVEPELVVIHRGGALQYPALPGEVCRYINIECELLSPGTCV